MNNRFVIRCSIDELRYDIRQTDDPIKKTMLKKFLDIKMNQLRSIDDDPSLDDLSENSISEETEKSEDSEDSDVANDESKIKKDKERLAAKKELDNIMKKQEESFNELDKLAKIKAYVSMINENRKDNDQQELIIKRGKTEGMWQNKDLYDPRYIKYQKEDVMNNKLMERLNSEIDFRIDDAGRMRVEKPFDDGDLNNTEDFAGYEKTEDEEIKYSSRHRNRDKLGLKRPIRRN